MTPRGGVAASVQQKLQNRRPPVRPRDQVLGVQIAYARAYTAVVERYFPEKNGRGSAGGKMRGRDVRVADTQAAPLRIGQPQLVRPG